ncbi:hypothetical protein [Streptomyces blattellae]|uniref:hypothetical protein n=1 Tax=Streptomyces blattellae TaxID=2569855 RepID=UPI0012B89DEC|nr:hypothetical protein [Streptomyces blattellae]
MVASNDLRMKLRRRREEERASKLPESLIGMRNFGYVQESEIPDWTRRKLTEWTRSTSSADSRICDKSRDEADRWIEEFADRAGTGKRFYCRTGMHFFPWIDCEATGSGWAKALRTAISRDLVIVSHDKKFLIVFFEEEYECLGFCSAQ